MAETFRVHDVAVIATGKYAGLVGTVTDTRADKGKQTQVRVKVDGVRDGEPVSIENWFRNSQVERQKNG